MLLPLFYLSLLVALTGAQSPPDAGGSGAPKYSSLPVSHDISSCPITYYGLKYTSLTARLDRPNGRIMLCFDLECNDFIELPDNTGGVTFQITQRDTELEGKLNESISDMDEQMTCSVQMTAAKGEGSVTVFLVQYETRAVLGIQNDLTSDGQYKINAYISNALEKYTTIGKGATNFRILTGCRMENGVYLMAGEDEYDLECGYYTCSVDSVLSVKGCPANKHCDIDLT
ncbi:uncharacterized protein LOC133420688 [Cololabis saira]|uniref:uncharacterized protein LOC133420688 n=1 Tax=Cololabis saira TaxID=129043 RepID=UPI002AD24BDC|nr:uncharacterized protein LOC133420688 [Cololabis saira]